ncbi:MAG: PilZ domain-containing protein [Proteobacteria bacterium]|nr:PilZ domain-containing protein [Pseudomonadota bacterium]MBU1709764.1 PilZ domain-containing protein [Pseudomonadota bacterium]
MAEEDRGLKRRHLIFYLEVYDENTNELLGHVVDLTTRGIKLVSKLPIPVGSVHKLRMELPEGYFEEKTLHFEAKCLWSTNDVNPDFFDAGFELTKGLDRMTRDILLGLIDQLGFND